MQVSREDLVQILLMRFMILLELHGLVEVGSEEVGEVLGESLMNVLQLHVTESVFHELGHEVRLLDLLDFGVLHELLQDTSKCFPSL